MNHPSGREPVPPHTVFLQRRAGPVSEGSFETRLGQGAFLALRLVDLLAPDRQLVHPDAFHYQHAATERYCEDLPAECAETAHLQGLVATVADAARAKDGRLVIPALFAYALHLEDRLKLGEAFDVLETLLRVGGDRVSAADAITTRLRMARVLRKLNELQKSVIETRFSAPHRFCAPRARARSTRICRIDRAAMPTKWRRSFHGVPASARRR